MGLDPLTLTAHCYLQPCLYISIAHLCKHMLEYL